MVAITIALGILATCARMVMRLSSLPTNSGSSTLVDRVTIQIQDLSITIATTIMA